MENEQPFEKSLVRPTLVLLAVVFVVTLLSQLMRDEPGDAIAKAGTEVDVEADAGADAAVEPEAPPCPELQRMLLQAPGTSFKIKDGRVQFLEPRSGAIAHELDEADSFVWQRATEGQQSLGQIAEALAREHGMDPASARRDVCRLARRLLDRGVAQLDDSQ